MSITKFSLFFMVAVECMVAGRDLVQGEAQAGDDIQLSALGDSRMASFLMPVADPLVRTLRGAHRTAKLTL